jgi:arginine-tRNA-protein transferase
MLVEVYQPKELSAARLDKLLAGGWFRTSSSISRLQYLCISDTIGSVINIRAKLDNYEFSRSSRKLLTKNKQRFSYIIRKASVDDFKEMLYQQQKSRFEIFVMDNLSIFLYDYLDEEDSVFDTYEVCVYDADRLVAVSFFDLGSQAIASILGLYDAEYQKYSLGIYTMLLEIEYAKSKGFSCYYPGYVVKSDKGYVFDYKLRLNNLQFRDKFGVWKPIRDIENEYWIHQIIEEKHQQIKKLLAKYSIDYEEILYPYFAIASFISSDRCVGSAIYFRIGANHHHQQLVLEYLIDKNTFVLGFASPLNDFFFSLMVENVKLSDKFVNSGNYYKHPLKYDEVVISSSSLPKVIAKIIDLKIIEG